MTWPSARRTMYGGCLKPESWYSPTSSMPSHRRGGGSAACGAGVVWASGVPAGGVLVAMESASARVGSPVGSERPHVREEALDRLRSRLVGLRDRGRLGGLRERDRVVRQDVRGDGGVDRRGHVRVDQRHRGALGQLLPGELVELLAGQRAVLLRGVLSHARLLLVGLGVLRSAVGLRDRRVLRRLGDGDRAVGERVQRDGRVHRRRNVGVDQRHRGALGQLLARELLELLARRGLVLLGGLIRHVMLLYGLPCWIGVCCAASAAAVAPSDSTLAAMAALIGIATLAFTSDMAARSGSSSPASSESSSRVSGLYWSGCFVIAPPQETDPGSRPGAPGPRPPRGRTRPGSPRCSGRTRRRSRRCSRRPPR